MIRSDVDDPLSSQVVSIPPAALPIVALVRGLVSRAAAWARPA